MKKKFVILYSVRRENFFNTFHDEHYDQWDLAYDRFKLIRSCPNCRLFYFAKLNDDSSLYQPIYYPVEDVNDLRKKWWRTYD